MENESSRFDRGSAFPKTQWTVIIDAVSASPERGREALEELCQLYRQPIVNWFRRKDFYQDPEDLAHSFVEYMLEKGLLEKVAPRTGRFRCFLTTCMRRFLYDSWDKNNSQKAGGQVEKVPLHDNDIEPEAEGSDDSQFDLDLAIAIHRRVMARLVTQEGLKPYIFLKDSTEGWDEIAARLGTTSTAIRQAVGRLRRRHWEAFKDEVTQIVAPAERAEETRYLYDLLFRNPPVA